MFVQHAKSFEKPNDAVKSMGIGLSVCKTVVAAHRGKIKGENIKGSGARFTVDLPLEEDEHEDQG
mgnify:CR=1 FL=1